MAVLHPERTYTLEEYLALEAESEERLEFEDGVLVAMSGETGQHNDIVTNIILALAERTRAKGCRIRHQNVKLHIQAGSVVKTSKKRGLLKGRYYYPDVMIVCGAPPQDPRMEINPCLVIEVLSPSTASRNKGRKMDAYLRLPSLELYLLVDLQVRKVGVYRRTAEGWLYEMLQDGAAKIPCIDAKLTLEQIYAGLDVGIED